MWCAPCDARLCIAAGSQGVVPHVHCCWQSMWCAPCALLLAVNVMCPMCNAAGSQCGVPHVHCCWQSMWYGCAMLLAVNVVRLCTAAGSQGVVPHVHCCWAVNVVRLCTAAGSQGVVPHVPQGCAFTPFSMPNQAFNKHWSVGLYCWSSLNSWKECLYSTHLWFLFVSKCWMNWTDSKLQQ